MHYTVQVIEVSRRMPNGEYNSAKQRRMGGDLNIVAEDLRDLKKKIRAHFADKPERVRSVSVREDGTIFVTVDPRTPDTSIPGMVNRTVRRVPRDGAK